MKADGKVYQQYGSKATKEDGKDLFWRIHLPNLLDEIMTNPTTDILHIPLSIFKFKLAELAELAIEIDNPKLHKIMLNLTLYDIADGNKHPDQEGYNSAMKELNKRIEKE
ncbi:MAG: hypothetical protein GY928_10195 [Colwellia sp.]|nr:hypothetical protein [Colwellia sp.]